MHEVSFMPSMLMNIPIPIVTTDRTACMLDFLSHLFLPLDYIF